MPVLLCSHTVSLKSLTLVTLVDGGHLFVHCIHKLEAFSCMTVFIVSFFSSPGYLRFVNVMSDMTADERKVIAFIPVIDCGMG